VPGEVLRPQIRYVRKLIAQGAMGSMSLDFQDIRTSMDVYTLDNVYLGTVLRIVAAERPPQREPAAVGAVRHSSVSGESLGPMPTQQLGNPGPRTQSAATGYATAPRQSTSLAPASIVVGKWWGVLGRRVVPLDWVQSVSFERIILKWRKDDLT